MEKLFLIQTGTKVSQTERIQEKIMLNFIGNTAMVPGTMAISEDLRPVVVQHLFVNGDIIPANKEKILVCNDFSEISIRISEYITNI